MKLNGLYSLYKDMKQKDENYASFIYRINSVEFDIFFDIFNQPFKLIFLQQHSNFRFGLDVEQGFEINPKLDKETYNKLVKILNIKYDPDNKFSPFKFFLEFNKKIPLALKDKVKKERVYQAYYQDVEEADKIYYKGKIEWNKLPDSKNSVTERNLFKTRILFPELYDTCKRNNISIKYTANKSEQKHIDSDFKNYL